jgi:hypothetical protein
MRILNTTRGAIDEAHLERAIGVDDRPDMIVVSVEYRLPDPSRPWLERELVRRDAYPLPKETDDPVITVDGLVPASELKRTVELIDDPEEIVVAVLWRPRAVDRADRIVKRSANVILKHPTVEAQAIAAALG